MDGKKFSVILSDFCNKKGFTEKEASDFEEFVYKMFQVVKDLMETRQYDFIAVKSLGTFFLKVWTVHNRIKALERELISYKATKMSLNHYNDKKIKYEMLQKVYKRMTDDFLSRKLYFAERKRERKEKGEEVRMNMQYMTSVATDDIEEYQQQNTYETDGDIKTSMGEQGADS